MIRSPLMNVMTTALKKAGRKLNHDFNEIENLQNSVKGPRDFASHAQEAVVKMLRNDLEKARHGYGFTIKNHPPIEGPDKTHRWIIDPIAGEENFTRAIPHFAINISLEREANIIATALYNPIQDELFQAEKTKGAWLNNRRMRIGQRENSENALFATQYPAKENEYYQKTLAEISKIAEKTLSLRSMGAPILDSAALCAARVDITYHRGLKIWTSAPARILIEEAGGAIENIEDKIADPLISGNIIAANPTLLGKIRTILKATE